MIINKTLTPTNNKINDEKLKQFLILRSCWFRLASGFYSHENTDVPQIVKDFCDYIINLSPDYYQETPKN